MLWQAVWGDVGIVWGGGGGAGQWGSGQSLGSLMPAQWRLGRRLQAAEWNRGSRDSPGGHVTTGVGEWGLGAFEDQGPHPRARRASHSHLCI